VSLKDIESQLQANWI